MSSNSPPPRESDIRDWIAAALDGYNPRQGPSWRTKVLGGRTMNDILANDVTPWRSVMVKMPARAASALARYHTRRKMSRSAYVRQALRTYLIEHEGMDPQDWPE